MDKEIEVTITITDIEIKEVVVNKTMIDKEEILDQEEEEVNLKKELEDKVKLEKEATKKVKIDLIQVKKEKKEIKIEEEKIKINLVMTGIKLIKKNQLKKKKLKMMTLI
jgi:hypothetical protein